MFQVERRGVCSEKYGKKETTCFDRSSHTVFDKSAAGELSSDRNQTVCDCSSKSISPGRRIKKKKEPQNFEAVFTALALLLTVSSVSHLVAGHGTEQSALCSAPRKICRAIRKINLLHIH